MSACLDAPIAGVPLDPLGFLVRGWVRPDPPFAPGEALEAWADGVCLGRTLTRHERPDVNQALGLAPGTRCGFELAAHHPGARGVPFSLELRHRPAVLGDHDWLTGPGHLVHQFQAFRLEDRRRDTHEDSH